MTDAFDLACLDMAGTTVSDGGMVEQAFSEALAELGVDADDPRRPGMFDYVRRTMGMSKIEVFRALFADEHDARRANGAFEDSYGRLVEEGAAAPLPGAVGAINSLRTAGIRVALTTGFAPVTRDGLLHALGWDDQVDVAVSPADAGRGRPFPDMIFFAMKILGVSDPRRVAVAGDTGADMEAGRSAGATVVVGVLTGNADRSTLVEAGATHVLASVADLPVLLGCG